MDNNKKQKVSIEIEISYKNSEHANRDYDAQRFCVYLIKQIAEAADRSGKYGINCKISSITNQNQ
jgi:hypothetical protein